MGKQKQKKGPPVRSKKRCRHRASYWSEGGARRALAELTEKNKIDSGATVFKCAEHDGKWHVGHHPGRGYSLQTRLDLQGTGRLPYWD